MRHATLALFITSLASAQVLHWPFYFLRGPATQPATIAVGDIDSDGDADLVFSTSVSINNGHGEFTSLALNVFLGIPGAITISRAVVTDVNGDGLQDFLCVQTANGSVTRMFERTSAQTFTDMSPVPTISFAGGQGFIDLSTGDIDGDGDIDVLYYRRIPLTRLSGNTFLEVPEVFFRNSTGLYVRASNAVMNNLLGRFILDGGSSYVITDIELGDIDSDGDADMVVGRAFSLQPNPNRPPFDLICIFEQTTGTYGVPRDSDFGGFFDPTADVDLFDADGDGDLDLLVANYSPAGSTIGTWLLLNAPGAGGNPTFVPPATTFTPIPGCTPPGPACQIRFDIIGFPSRDLSSAPVDIDLDGDIDVLISGMAAGVDRTFLFRNGPVGTFTLDPAWGTIVSWAFASGEIQLGDLDSDLDIDVVLADGLNNNTTVLTNGDRQLTAPPVVTVPPSNIPSIPITFLSQPSYNAGGGGDVAFVFLNTVRNVPPIAVPGLGFAGLAANPSPVLVGTFSVPSPDGIVQPTIVLSASPLWRGNTVFLQVLKAGTLPLLSNTAAVLLQ